MHRAVIHAMCAPAIANAERWDLWRHHDLAAVDLLFRCIFIRGARLCAAQAEELTFNANVNTPGASAGNIIKAPYDPSHVTVPPNAIPLLTGYAGHLLPALTFIPWNQAVTSDRNTIAPWHVKCIIYSTKGRNR